MSDNFGVVTPNASPIQLCNTWDLSPCGLCLCSLNTLAVAWQQFTAWSVFSRSKLIMSIQGIVLYLSCLKWLQKGNIIAQLSRRKNYYTDSETYARSCFVQLHCKSTHHPTKITDCTILFLGRDFQILSSWPKHAPRLLLATLPREELTRLW